MTPIIHLSLVIFWVSIRRQRTMSLLGDCIKESAFARGHGMAMGVYSSSERRIVQRVSFVEFARIASAYSRALQRAGVLKGNLAVILSHPTSSYFYTVAGLWLLGAAPVNISWRQPLVVMQRMASMVKCAVVLATAHFVERGIAGELLPNRTVYILDAARKSKSEVKGVQKLAATFGHMSVPLLTTEEEEEVEDGGGGRNDLRDSADTAVVMFTSGSTGNPKGVPLTHGGLLWSCRAKLNAHGGQEAVENGTLSFLPNFHVMGFTNNFLFNIAVAQCPFFVHEEYPMAPLCLAVLQDAIVVCKPSILDTIPSILEGISILAREGSAAQSTQELIQSLRACKRVLYGGCALSTGAFDALTGLQIEVASQYGQTELGGMILIGEPPGSGGIPSEMKVVPGCVWRAAEDGELIILDCEAATVDYIHNGILPSKKRSREHQTKDLFSVVKRRINGHEEWWFKHLCRKDDLIVHSTGEMTNPIPLEDKIASMMNEAIVHVCIVGQQRAYPVVVIARASNWKGNFEAMLASALKEANAIAPAYSRLRQNRVILKKDPMPTSAKGNIIRHAVETDNAEEMDLLDRRLFIGKEVENSKNEGEDEEEEVVDSMQIVRQHERILSVQNIVFTHLYAICMFSVLQAHALWPRRMFWTEKVMHCSWLSNQPLLADLHKGLEILCIPVMVTVTGMRDCTHKGNDYKRARALIRSAISAFFIYMISFYISEAVATAYNTYGTNCAGEPMRKVLWFLIFLGTCRFTKALCTILQLKDIYVAGAVCIFHFFLRGRIMAYDQSRSFAGYILIDMKVLNYSLFYFAIPPLLKKLGIPTSDAARPYCSSRRIWILLLLMCTLAIVPMCFPQWFTESYQVLSEIPAAPIVGPGMDVKLLTVHLMQLGFSLFFILISMEAAPRHIWPMAITLGSGTLSAFILHWWTRPIWLKCIVIVIQRLAPMLHSCDAARFKDSIFASIVVAGTHLMMLLLVQWCLSAWKIDFGSSAKEQNDLFPRSKCVTLMRSRGFPLVRSLLKIGCGITFWCFLHEQVKIQPSDPTKMYAGGRCAAVIPNVGVAGTSSPLMMDNSRDSTHAISTLKNRGSLNLESIDPGMRRGVCLVVGSQPMMGRGGFCSTIKSRMQLIPNEATPKLVMTRAFSENLMLQIIPCLNQDYASNHGLGFFMPSAPWLTTLRSSSHPRQLQNFTKSISHFCEPSQRCFMRQLQQIMIRYHQGCTMMAVISPDFLLLPLHHSLQLLSFFNSKFTVFTTQNHSEFFQEPFKSKHFFLLRNSQEGVDLLADWLTKSPRHMMARYSKLIMPTEIDENEIGIYLPLNLAERNVERYLNTAINVARRKWVLGKSTGPSSVSSRTDSALSRHSA